MTEEREDWISPLADLEDEEARRAFLASRPDLRDRAAAERLSQELVRASMEDLRRAERLAAALRWLAESGDEACRAAAEKGLGHAGYVAGRYEEAVEHYRAAAALFRSLGEEIELAITLSGSLQAQGYLGRYREAMADARTAREIFARHGDRLRLARLDNNEGNLLVRQDRHQEAMELFRRALAELRDGGSPQDIAAVLTNIGVSAIELHDFATALDAYRELSAHCQRHGMKLAGIQADYNIAYLYYQRGEYTRALELYRAVRELGQDGGDPYELALCDLDQAEIYLELNLAEEGQRLAHLAFAAFEDLGMGYEAAKALAFLAVAAQKQSRAFQALQLFDEARRRFVEQDNRVWPAIIDLYEGLILHDERRSFEARNLAERSLALFQGIGQDAKAALCELLLARIHLQVGEPGAARRRCLSALARLEELDIPASSAKGWFVLGQSEEALGDRQAALGAYQEAHVRLESLRSQLRRDELKVSFFRDKLELYQSLVALTMAGEPTPADQRQAFLYIEQAKSRSLADLIAFRAHALPSPGGQSELVDRMRLLREELNWYYRQLDLYELRMAAAEGPGRPATDPARIEELRRLSEERESELLKVLGELRELDAELGSLQTATALDIDSIQASIPEGTLLIEYYEARGTLYVCLVGADRLEVLPVTTALRVRELQRLLQFQLSKFRLGSDYCRTFAEQIREATSCHLAELSAELIAPIRDRLDAEHLVIVPHGSLHYVPFHALADGDRYLIDRWSISYAPSASVFSMCCTRPADPREGALVLGLADPSTPHILEEIEAVASSVPGARVFLGDEATEERLRTLGRDSRLLHIATHGFFRQDNPMFSAIQLGGSRLTLFDLYQLELAAELVVLSGCGTGLNVVESGDELIGLTRGLLYAGARSAMVTLWDVHDKSTADFMTFFYRRFAERPDRAAALRSAMQDLRTAYPHPYYWAPFILVGKPFPGPPSGAA